MQDFSESLDAITGGKMPWWGALLPFLKLRPSAQRPKPRVFLYYGEGGFGKSHMLQKCIELAGKKQFRTVSLDWDEYYARRSTLPNTSAKMITALFTVLTEPEPGIAGYFDEYLKIEKKLKEIADKIERVWKEDASAVIAPAVKAGSARAQGKTNPGAKTFVYFFR